jgi:hypothetical protein
VDETEKQYQALLESINETIAQIQSLRDSITTTIPAELRMASLIEYQMIFGEAQHVQQTILNALAIIATSRQAVALEASTKEYRLARKSSEALAKSYGALQKAFDRARDGMERGVVLEPVYELLRPMVDAIQDTGTLIILLARHSEDEAITEQAGRLEEGLAQIEREGARQRLKVLAKNLNVLLEQEAKFGGNVPLALTNQIDDIKAQIGETRKLIK